jgi:ATP-dependent protease HslVU (ClpYQ) peptidase subunit
MCVRRKNKVVIAADGQVTRGERVMKQMARSRSGCVKRAAAPCGELITLL